MSIATELQDLETYLSNAYDSISDKGGTIPQNKNMYNLANAIDSISASAPIIIPPSAGTLQSIAVTTSPTKTSYIEGEYFNYSGCVITAIYQNATYDVTNYCTFICNQPLQYGDTSVQVNYEGQSTSIAITVSAVPIPAPLSTKLLLHCNGNLTNEVTGDTTGITGTYNQVLGKFDYGHDINGSTYWLQFQNFQPSSNYSNWGFGWWTKAGAGNYGNTFFEAPRYGTTWTYILQMDANGYAIPNSDNFSYSNIQRFAQWSSVASFNAWNYFAIQITSSTISCYINGNLSSQATLNGINANLASIRNHNSSSNMPIDEVIIAEDNIYQKNNAEWIIT